MINQQIPDIDGRQRKERTRVPIFSIMLTLIALVVFQIDNATEFLQYDRYAIESGQLWRLVTGHWVHWSTDHLYWDVLLFCVTGILCEKISRPAFFAIILTTSLLVSSFIWYGLPQMILYRGLSGLDSGLFLFLLGWLTFSRCSQENAIARFFSGTLLLLFFAKIGYETLTGQGLFVNSTQLFTPVPIAHMIGGLVGLITLILHFQILKDAALVGK